MRALSRQATLDLRHPRSPGCRCSALFVLRHRSDEVRAQPHRLRRSSTRPFRLLGGSRRSRPCVFMGMGEPMLNLDAVFAACERAARHRYHRPRTAISTVGLIPGIERLAEQPMPLRSPSRCTRRMRRCARARCTVNDRYPLKDVIEACRCVLRAQASPACSSSSVRCAPA